MRDENLRRFNGDKNTKTDLKEYLISYFEEAILKRAYDGGDVKPLANAVLEVKKAFSQLDIVLDTFLGSGSTLIASEKTNRKCYGISAVSEPPTPPPIWFVPNAIIILVN